MGKKTVNLAEWNVVNDLCGQQTHTMAEHKVGWETDSATPAQVAKPLRM